LEETLSFVGNKKTGWLGLDAGFYGKDSVEFPEQRDTPVNDRTSVLMYNGHFGINRRRKGAGCQGLSLFLSPLAAANARIYSTAKAALAASSSE
jgi:hypothetical protein